ncbi:MAG: NAD(P)H-hydrate dehydratase [Gammaproteobacteria bacterium]
MALTPLQKHLPPRKPDAHKGDFGHVLVIGGDKGFAGAVRLAGEAALRVGAGLVSIATHPDHAALICATRPELMCHGVHTSEDLKKLTLLQRATVIIIGPGLGQSAWAQDLFNTVLACKHSIIIDADGLNLLAQDKERKIFRPYENHMLTPHPGEAARLLSCNTAEIQADRKAAITQLHKKFGGVCILKGAGTLVLGDDKNIYECTEGNPGMATGGMGDVLSGVIGGLVAQNIDLTTAACLGVTLHARAGDKAAHEHGQRGLVASDLFPYLQQLVNPPLQAF